MLPASRSDSARRSIAVLPFANLTGDPGKDFLGEGLAEELIHTLIPECPDCVFPPGLPRSPIADETSICAELRGSST